MTETTPLPERNLDLLRAVAVASVVLDHVLTNTLPLHSNYHPATTLGHFGVLLFFVHTALVLMGSLERQGDRANWVQAFYLRRAFRIYPLSIAAVLFVLALHDPAAGHSPPRGVTLTFPPLDATTIISNLALVQNLTASRNILGPLWTLPIELQMYLFLPVCFLLARRSAWHVLGLFVAFGVAYEIVAHPPFPELQRLGVFAYAPCFLAGVLAYHLCRRGSAPRLPAWTLFLTLAIGYAWLFVVIDRPHRPLTWITPLGVGALLPFIRQARASWLTRLAHTICTYSYGVYLLHVPVLWIANERLVGAPIVLRIMVAVVGLLGLPWLAYHLIEKPGIDFGKRVVRGPVSDAAYAPAP